MPAVVKVTSGLTVLQQLRISSQRLDAELARTKREIAEDSEIIFAAHALKRSGRMARNIRSEQRGEDVLVVVEARATGSGFDYVRITRFGHRVARIYPRRDRRAASVIATRRPRGTVRKGNAALRFTINGRVMYRRSVRGFHPASDWAARALPQVELATRQNVRRLRDRLVGAA